MVNFFETAINRQSPGALQTDACSNYDVLASLQKYGLGSLDTKLYPESKHVAQVKSLSEQIRKATGAKCPFVSLDVRSDLFNSKERGDDSDPPAQPQEDEKNINS